MKLSAGQQIPEFVVKTIQGIEIRIPDRTAQLTHLQFRRYAACPICNFHLHRFFRYAAKLQAARIREVIFFHSSAEEMQKFQKQLAHLAVADPGRELYSRFAVGTSLLAARHPRAIWAALKGMALGKIGMKAENGANGLPADFLINGAGKIVAVKYGRHAYDQWDVEDVLAIANEHRTDLIDKTAWHWPTSAD